MCSVIDLHIKGRTADLNKFKIFCKMNSTMPYKFKKKALQACILHSLLYGCESWLSSHFSYFGALKAILGVRRSTRNDIIMLESGMPTLKDLVAQKTVEFVRKNINDDVVNTPLAKVFKMCEEEDTNGYKYLKSLLEEEEVDNRDGLKEKFLLENGTRAINYWAMNPNLEVHDVYATDNYIEERKRIVFTRFRVSSHNFKIETGRWSRTVREQRLCECGIIQDETHVIFDCEKTQAIRERFMVNREIYRDIGELMNRYDYVNLVNFIDECMNKF